MTTRRGFLKSILALAAAPAIVKASSLMPIYVPKPEVFTFGTGDFTVEAWMSPVNDGWHHIALVKDSTGVKHYFDGVGIDYLTLKNKGFELIPQNNSGQLKAIIEGNEFTFISKEFKGNVHDIKVAKGPATKPTNFINTLYL